MSRMRRLLMPLFLIVALLPIPMNAFAEDINSHSNMVQVDDLKIEIDYDLNEVDLIRTEKPNEVIIDVIDKESGKVLQTIGEKTLPFDLSIISGRLGNRHTLDFNIDIQSTGLVTTKYIYKDEKHGPSTVRLESYLIYYTEGSYARQINGIDVISMRLTTSGYQTLADVITSGTSVTGQFPTTGVIISGTGTVQVETNETRSGEFSISFLEQAGFSFGGSVGNNYYYRKVVSMNLRYDVY